MRSCNGLYVNNQIDRGGNGKGAKAGLQNSKIDRITVPYVCSERERDKACTEMVAYV